jgi:DNA invertase Pin-like site-specific DNA recombinase
MSKRSRTASRTTSTRRVVGYVRVSTGKQADTGHSLEAQRAKLDAYCALYGYELLIVEADEGASASTTDGRPGLARALELCRAGKADAVLVVKLDRLCRSLRDLGALLERARRGGWEILSVGEQLDTSSASGRLVASILGAVHQWEREAAAERTSAAMQGMRTAGLYTGGIVRYGFKLGADGRTLEEDADEQRVLVLVRELRAKGLSLRAVARDLEAAGYYARGGKSWAPYTLSKLEEAA